MPFVFVQSDNNDDSASGATIAATYDAPVTAGNFLICVADWGTTEGTPTCSDDVNGAWAAAGTQLFDASNNQGLKAFIFPNTAAGTPTVTVNFGAARPFRGIIIAEYSGVKQTNPLDVAAASAEPATAGSGADNASLSITPSVAGLLIIGFLVDTNGSLTLTAGTNYTEREDVQDPPGEDGIQAMSLQDRINAPAGAQNVLWSMTNTNNYLALAFSFLSGEEFSRPWVE